MKESRKIAVIGGLALLLVGGLFAADRYSTICPVHKVQAAGTGHVRKNGTECEYSHYVKDSGATHTFWASCD